MDRIVVFDVETPNFNNGRICAIGISVIENGETVNSQYSPVNPECACDCEKLNIHGKGICLTGEFDCGSRSEIGEKLISLGANIHANVTQKTDILIVGGQGSGAWSVGNYGNKIKKTLEIQGKGIGILLLREPDFFSALEG